MKYVLVSGVVLLTCVFLVTRVSAAQAPVEDRSTISPTATSDSTGTESRIDERYSRDLREPYSGEQSSDERSSEPVSVPVQRPLNSAVSETYDSRAIERPVYSSTGISGPTSGIAADVSGNAQLFYKVQVLEQEIRELRGLLEEQTHQLNRLAREQKDQYLDLDRRLSQRASTLQGSSPRRSPVLTPGINAGNAERVSTGSAGEDPETSAYNTAFALTREKRYQEAIEGFNALVMNFPNGKLTGNAFYWLGELYLTLEEPELEKSRQSFVQVINSYPDHAKTPDSLYKLGVVYHRLGEMVRARQYLNQVISQYPASAAARLAQSYLADLP